MPGLDPCGTPLSSCQDVNYHTDSEDSFRWDCKGSIHQKKITINRDQAGLDVCAKLSFLLGRDYITTEVVSESTEWGFSFGEDISFGLSFGKGSEISLTEAELGKDLYDYYESVLHAFELLGDDSSGYSQITLWSTMRVYSVPRTWSRTLPKPSFYYTDPYIVDISLHLSAYSPDTTFDRDVMNMGGYIRDREVKVPADDNWVDAYILFNNLWDNADVPGMRQSNISIFPFSHIP